MLTRRDWLKAAAAGLVGCTLPPDRLLFPDADPDQPLQPGPIEPEHAAAAFEAGETEALLSVWAPAAHRALPVIEELGGDVQLLGEVFDVVGDLGGTGVGALTGLAPGRSYRWHLRFDNGYTTDWYQLRTAPPADQAAPLTLVYSADVDPSPSYDSPIVDTLAARGADLYVSLGDWPYADNSPAAVTVDDYRAKHREARAMPRMQPLLHAMSVRAIWDDHEYRNNWDARLVAADPDRAAAAVQVWDEWFPLFDQSTPRRRYRSWRWGRHAELFLLDTRMYRSSDTAPDDADKTMLGAEQKQWLIDRVIASDATFKLVFSTIPLDFGNDNDDWSEFSTERDQIFAALGAAAVERVLWLSADQHWFEANHHPAGFIEWQVGPLARAFRAPPPIEDGVVARVTGVYNYGEVVITDGDPPVLTFTARDPDGGALYTETVSG
ncbi:MAG TPA: alkaline phosphatase D family protein [Kofleriaceae bacterium]|nr:alkaline phosphatase D family protein [Kofleriaceae bacterium]